MNIFDMDYNKKEKNLFKYHYTCLLSELLILNYEFLVSREGIGYLIIYGTQVFNLSLVMAGILILLIISFLLYKIITLLENKLIKKF